MAALSRMKCTNVTLQSPKLEAASTIYAWALPKLALCCLFYQKYLFLATEIDAPNAQAKIQHSNHS